MAMSVAVELLTKSTKNNPRYRITWGEHEKDSQENLTHFQDEM